MPWLVRAFFQYRDFFSAISPDILHIHNLEYGFVPAGLAWTGPLVLTTYGLDVTKFHEHGGPFVPRRLKKWLLGHADIVTSASRYLLDETVNLGRINPSHGRVTPFGVDTFRFSPRERLRESDSITIGMPKDLKSEYAPLDFVRAMGELILRGRRVHGFLQGTGPQLEEVRALILKLGLQDVLEIRGRVPLDEMPSVYAAMDICVMPSIQESFGVAALEAQSMCVPVVATPVEGLKEVLLDGVTGLYVAPGDPYALANALDQLILDPVLRRTMGEAGRNFVLENFDWRVSVKIMEDIYMQLLSSRRNR